MPRAPAPTRRTASSSRLSRRAADQARGRHLRLRARDGQVAATRELGPRHRRHRQVQRVSPALGGIPGDDPESSGAGFHGGSRNDTRYCVVATPNSASTGAPRRRSTRARSPSPANTYVVDGRASATCRTTSITSTWASFWPRRTTTTAACCTTRHCSRRTCATAPSATTARLPRPRKTAQGDNWKNAPSRRACGACHDGINFATGMGVTIADALKGLTLNHRVQRPGARRRAQSDDSTCSTCHTPDNIDKAHLPVTPPNTKSALHMSGGNSNTNAAWIASNTSRLPAGAIKVTYDIQSVSRNASKQPEMVFRLLQNGQRKDLNDFATAAAESGDRQPGALGQLHGRAERTLRVLGAAGWHQRAGRFQCQRLRLPEKHLDHGTGAPASGAGHAHRPRRQWLLHCHADRRADTGQRGDADRRPGVLVQRDEHLAADTDQCGDVAWRSTATASAEPLYPVSPSPVGQTNRVGGLIVIAPNVQMVADRLHGSPADRRRRPLQQVPPGTGRVHRRMPSTAASATTARPVVVPQPEPDQQRLVGRFHQLHPRDPWWQQAHRCLTWHASAVGESFADVKFPGVLQELRGLPRSVAPTTSVQSGLRERPAEPAVPHSRHRLLCPERRGHGSRHTAARPAPPVASAPQTDVGAYSISPYVQGYPGELRHRLQLQCRAHGRRARARPTATPVSTPRRRYAAADPRTLVNSPIATACFACHDTDLARAHMQANGGSILCAAQHRAGHRRDLHDLPCTGHIADIKVMHAK